MTTKLQAKARLSIPAAATPASTSVAKPTTPSVVAASTIVPPKVIPPATASTVVPSKPSSTASNDLDNGRAPKSTTAVSNAHTSVAGASSQASQVVVGSRPAPEVGGTSGTGMVGGRVAANTARTIGGHVSATSTITLDRFVQSEPPAPASPALKGAGRRASGGAFAGRSKPLGNGAGKAGYVQPADQVLRETPGFTALPVAVQGKAIEVCHELESTAPAAARQLGALLNSTASRLLSAEDKCRLLDVFRAANQTGRDQLLELVQRTSPGVSPGGSTGSTTPLLEKDSAGISLLDCLSSAASASTGPLTHQTRTAQGTLSSLLTEASRPWMQNVGPAERTALREISTGHASPELLAAYQRIVRSENFNALGAVEQGRVMYAMAHVTADPTWTPVATSATSLAELVEQPMFNAQCGDLLDIFNTTGRQARADLVELAKRPAADGLLNRDSKGGTLLDSLHQIAIGPLDQQFAQNSISRESLLSGVLQEVARPGQIDQGARWTCTVTSMQWMLCVQNPAEYARLMQGLLSPAGRATLANGDSLNRVTDSIAPDDSPSRGPTERIFQAAMMDYSDDAGIEEKYDNTDADDILRGMSVYEQRRGLEGLFGRDFHLWGPKGYVHRDLFDVVKDCMPTPTLIDLYWGRNPDGSRSSHAVAVARVDEDRVYFRNPWGLTGAKAGDVYPEPPRRMEDPANDIESMSIGEFREWVKNVYEAD